MYDKNAKAAVLNIPIEGDYLEGCKFNEQGILISIDGVDYKEAKYEGDLEIEMCTIHSYPISDTFQDGLQLGYVDVLMTRVVIYDSKNKLYYVLDGIDNIRTECEGLMTTFKDGSSCYRTENCLVSRIGCSLEVLKQK